MKKKILLLCTFFASLFIFINRADAIVMWMQCTDEPSGKMKGIDEDYYKYNTFAVINNIGGGDTRILSYIGSNMFSGYQPVYVAYGDAEKEIGNFCWYQNYTTEIEDCEKETDLIDRGKMHDGYCPEGIIEHSDRGSTAGDFLVLYGQKKADEKNIEILDKPIFVIYGIQKPNGEVIDYIAEGYDNQGVYSWATTWKDWDSFKLRLGLNLSGGNISELISRDDFTEEFRKSNKITKATPYSYDNEYMNWTQATQVIRIDKFGRDYFKLIDNRNTWLINLNNIQNYDDESDEGLVIRETNDEGKNIMFDSEDSNGNFANYTEEWYKGYAEILDNQLSSIEKIAKGSEYVQLINAAEKISDAVSSGEKYSFDKEYSASQMVIDLEKAYNLLKPILEEGEFGYEYYNEDCEKANDTTSNPLGSVSTKFNCEVFGVDDLEATKNGKNKSRLNDLIITAIGNSIDKLTSSEISITKIRENAEYYATIFTKAIKYIKSNETLTVEAEKIMVGDNDNDGLEKKYSDMTSSFGVEVIVTCEDLIGEELRDKIKSYLNIIKIAVPIILIAFGIIDFSKAVFASDEDKMKTAQKDFIKRLGIAILIFFVPTIVDLLLGLANQVWYFIQPGSCGIF